MAAYHMAHQIRRHLRFQRLHEGTDWRVWSWWVTSGPVIVACGVAMTLTGAEWACWSRTVFYAAGSRWRIHRVSTIRSRWAGKAAIRKKLLATARAKAAFWRGKKKTATGAAKAHAGAMLAAREQLVAKRKAEVEFAERILRRHTSQPLRVKALNFAEHALAQHIFEQGGNNRGPMVEQIIRYAGGQVGEPWCADFVIYCYGHAGSNVVKPGFPRAVSMMNHQTGTHITSDPKPGDIVRYTFDHTGIFVRDLGNGTIETIEGNTGAAGAVSDGNGSDGVYKKIRAKSLVADFLSVVS